MKSVRILILLTFFVAALLGFSACQGEVGERCDGFFKNTCRSPASCVHTDEGAWCANSCTGGECDEGYECVMVTVNGLPAGGHCLPVQK
jgi:hypothetical protein